jgi:CcmD family protein
MGRKTSRAERAAVGAAQTAGAGIALASTWLAPEVRAQDAAEDRATSFQAVQGGVREDIAGGPLLLAAYAVIWVAVLLYVFRLVRLQQRAQQDLARLESVLAKKT